MSNSIVAELRKAIRLREKIFIRYKALNGQVVEGIMSPEYVRSSNGSHYVTICSDLSNGTLGISCAYLCVWVDDILEIRILSNKKNQQSSISKIQLVSPNV